MRLRRGDGELEGSPAAPESAWAEIYRTHVAEIFDLVARTVRDRGAAGEVPSHGLAATVFGRLAERVESPPEIEAARLELLGIAHQVVTGELPDRRETEPLHERWDLAIPSGEGSSRDAAELVWEAAAGLPRGQYVVLDLAVRRRLTDAQLGTVLGVSERQAGARRSRAAEALSKRLRVLMVARRRPLCADLARLLPRPARTLTVDQHLTAERHLRRCPACRGPAAEVRAPLQVLAQLLPPPLPPELAGRVPSPPRRAMGRSGSLRAWAGRIRSTLSRLPGGPRLRAALAVGLGVVLAGTAALGIGHLLPQRAEPGLGSRPPGVARPTPAPPPVLVSFVPGTLVQRFVVPCGVRLLHVLAIAGSGGTVVGGSPPGRGATISADVAVQPDQLMLVVVGSNGEAAQGSGGGAGGGGTGLGMTAAGRPAGDLLAAGGGGGTGGNPVGVAGAGGAGGDGDGAGGHAAGLMGGAGGAPGLQSLGSAGGAGGVGATGTGAIGGPGTNRGGLGGAPNGGGGATGHFAGGGGGGGGSLRHAIGGGGGGGGGSSYAAPGVTVLARDLDPGRSPRLTISYVPAACSGR